VRDFGHRVKSVSAAVFTEDDISAMQRGGNENCKRVWLAKWTPGPTNRLPDGSDIHELKEFMRKKYVDKRWYASDIAPTLIQQKPADSTTDQTRQRFSISLASTAQPLSTVPPPSTFSSAPASIDKPALDLFSFSSDAPAVSSNFPSNPPLLASHSFTQPSSTLDNPFGLPLTNQPQPISATQFQYQQQQQQQQTKSYPQKPTVSYNASQPFTEDRYAAFRTIDQPASIFSTPQPSFFPNQNLQPAPSNVPFSSSSPALFQPTPPLTLTSWSSPPISEPINTTAYLPPSFQPSSFVASPNPFGTHIAPSQIVDTKPRATSNTTHLPVSEPAAANPFIDLDPFAGFKIRPLK